MDHLELRLDLLLSQLYRKDRPALYKKDKPPLHKEGKPPLYKKGLIEDDIDAPRVRFGRFQPALSLTTLFVASPVAFFSRVSLTLPPLNKKSIDL